MISYVRPTTLALAILVGLGATSGSAQSNASEQTLGELLASGKISQAALVQLIAGSGIDAADAKEMTLNDIVTIKWQDD